MTLRTQILSLILVILLAALAPAQATQPTDEAHRGPRAARVRAASGGDGPAAAVPASQPGEDKLTVTTHQLTVGGKTLHYRATAGTIAMKDEAGKPKADFFFTAYELLPPPGQGSTTVPADTRTADVNRPVTFVFNGGPGAASVWLHLGVVGPRRIDFPDDGIPGPPPYRLVDNESTWLDFTDVVLIDPVGTGYSRPAAGEDGKQFWGVEQDVASVADFIRVYLTRYGRWTSPKFLAGESYGTTRAARLSDYLADRYGVNVNGIVLVSTVLSFQTLSPGDANDLPYVLFVPTYTYTAAYHKKLAPDLMQDIQKTLREVEAFAVNEYQPALLKGASLPAEERRAIVEKLARYTSLPAEYIERANLRVGPGAFQKELLDAERKIIGRFDGRLTAFDPSPNQPSPSFDPSYVAYNGPYSSCYHQYVRTELKYESDLTYEILTGRVRPWDYGLQGGGYVNSADELRNAMIKNPHLKVLVAEGMYDFATPYFASDYTLNQMDLPENVRSNITRTYYDGGHMMYHVAAARVQLTRDVRGFFEGALKK